MLHYQDLMNSLDQNNFDLYLSTQSLEHSDGNILHDIYTCTKGKYSSDVVDIYYNFGTDEVIKIEYSNQNGKPCKFNF